MLLVNLCCNYSFVDNTVYRRTGGSQSIFDDDGKHVANGLYDNNPLSNSWRKPVEKCTVLYRNFRDLRINDDIKYAISGQLANGVRTTIDDNLIQKLIAKVG